MTKKKKSQLNNDSQTYSVCESFYSAKGKDSNYLFVK